MLSPTAPRILGSSSRVSKWRHIAPSIACSFTFNQRLFSTRTSDPLRILFCGSDDFSCAALRAVHAEHIRSKALIESIDVVIRPGKPTGRGHKKIQDVPLKATAQELGLRIHERDTFTGWTPPSHASGPVNLIIAVSFGLFVPPRLLKAATYGGLNVHPSLLPDLRGPAPLQHALLADREHVGITLQTLHPENFDAGIVLAQTPSPGLPIPNHSTCKYHDLLDFIAPKAADFLVENLRERVFVPPLVDKTLESLLEAEEAGEILEAPKIEKKDHCIDWRTWPADKIARYDRVLGRLWTTIELGEEAKPRRAIFGNIEEVPLHPILEKVIKRNDAADLSQEEWNNLDKEILPYLLSLDYVDDKGNVHRMPAVLDEEDAGAVIILAADKNAVKIREITLDSEGKQSAARVLKRGKRTDKNGRSWLSDGIFLAVADSII